MALVKSLLESPAVLSTASKYTALNGIIYLAAGALLIVWPGATQTIFMDRAFVGDESGLMRAIGMAVVVIGWFYLIGGRSGARQLVAASILPIPRDPPQVVEPLSVAGPDEVVDRHAVQEREVQAAEFSVVVTLVGVVEDTTGFKSSAKTAGKDQRDFG